MSRSIVVVPVLLGLLAACGSDQAPEEAAPDPSAPGHTLPDEADRVPITPRAIAAIMLEHLPKDTTLRAATWIRDEDPPETVGADLRYHGTGGNDGDLVAAVVQPDDGSDPCGEYDDGCEELDTAVEGAELWLSWQEEVPEEDPGVVTLVLLRGDERTHVGLSGPVITGDPRELDLLASVEQMRDVIEDPWLRLMTSPEAVAAGKRVDDWEDWE